MFPSRIALFIFLSAVLRAEEGIRILSADPDDNVLLEISAEEAMSVMSSQDLENWSYVFHFVPPCQGFKAYAPQKSRKKTYFKLAPVHPHFEGMIVDDEVPVLAGKRFENIGSNFSFSEGGQGTLNYQDFEGAYSMNTTYSVVDSRPGMISVRSSVADGQKFDHLILFSSPSSPIPLEGETVAYTSERFGDFFSNTWADGQEEAIDVVTSYYIGTEIPPGPLNWTDPVGTEISLCCDSYDTVTLGPNGVASLDTGESASYEFIPTGNRRATLFLQRQDGSRTAMIFRSSFGPAYRLAEGAAPYSGTQTENASIRSTPSGSGS